ncbi:hypothetical protein HYX03_00975 [Candidatus Woesearchaeota archaeon]|nr:hypothetical protein [Candidatus Woesearchaeota archaeon]
MTEANLEKMILEDRINTYRDFCKYGKFLYDTIFAFHADVIGFFGHYKDQKAFIEIGLSGFVGTRGDLADSELQFAKDYFALLTSNTFTTLPTTMQGYLEEGFTKMAYNCIRSMPSEIMDTPLPVHIREILANRTQSAANAVVEYVNFALQNISQWKGIRDGKLSGAIFGRKEKYTVNEVLDEFSKIFPGTQWVPYDVPLI